MFDIEAPWYNYYKKIYNLFSVDIEVTVDEDLTENEDGNFEFTISSKNAVKLEAIEAILGYGRVFGNVKVLIKYGYENMKEENYSETYKKAFSGNPLFKEVIDIEMPFHGKSSYVVFKKDIITFYDDNLSDYRGNNHYIVADLVKDVVANTKLFICTEDE